MGLGGWSGSSVKLVSQYRIWVVLANMGLYRACTGGKQGVLAHILYWDTGLTEGWVWGGWSGSSVKPVSHYRIWVVLANMGLYRAKTPLNRPILPGFGPYLLRLVKYSDSSVILQ